LHAPSIALPARCIAAGISSATISNVILQSSSVMPASISIQDLLQPPLLARGVPVNLTNVQLLYAVPQGRHAEAVAALRGVVSDLDVQQAVASWSLNLYTVRLQLVKATCPVLSLPASNGSSNYAWGQRTDQNASQQHSLHMLHTHEFNA
jgi:hypothetical protein